MQSRRVTISKSNGQQAADWVACEEPLEILVKTADGDAYDSLSLTMRTPGDDLDLVRGFLFSEGVIDRDADVAELRHAGELSPNTGLQNQVAVDLRKGKSVAVERLARHFMATSSCGICGRASLDALEAIGCSPVQGTGFEVASEMLLSLPTRLAKDQRGFEETGGLHGAAMFDLDGQVSDVCEDIGRHNALDKLVGKLIPRLPTAPPGILVSSRTSFELVQKVIRVGSPMLVSVGAASSLAIEAADRFGVTLVGFLRDNRFNVYTHPHRVAC